MKGTIKRNGIPVFQDGMASRVIAVSLETMKIVRRLPPVTEAEVYPKAEKRESLMVAERVARRD